MATVPFPWRFELDLNRNNLWEFDFTSYVQSANWSLGMSQAFAHLANDAKATFKVKNTSGEFNPENTSVSNPFVVDGENLLRPHCRARVAFNRYASRVTSGRIMDLYLNETSGTTAGDASSEGNNAVYSGATLNNVDSYIPNYRAPHFDGNDVVNLYSAGLLADFDPALGSFSLWLKVDDIAIWSETNNKWLLRLFADANNRIDIFKNTSPADQLIFWYYAGGTLEQVVVDITPTTDWIHIAMTWNKAGDRVRVYVNGAQSGGDQTGLGTWTGNITPFTSTLGAAVSDGTLGWEGYLSHFRLYNRELTAAEVETLAGTGDEIMYVGWIKRIKPPYQPAGNFTGKVDAVITCEGIKSRLETVVVPFGVYTNTTADQVIEDALRLAAIPPSGQGGWLAGKPGYSEAGVTTFAGSNDGFFDFDTGTTTFPLLGDKEMTGWQACKLVTEGERGFLWQARNGKAVFRNRHERQTNITSQATITDTSNKAVEIEYEWDVDVIKNAARVTVNPRKTASSTTVHDQQTAISVPAGGTKTYEVPFRDGDGKLIGVSGSVSGAPLFSGATPVTTITNLGDRAQVEIDNSANTSGATLTGLGLSGTPIQDRDPVVGTAMDATSVGRYGKRELVLNIPALNTLQQAEDIAQYEVNRRKDARPSVDSVSFLRAGNDSDNTLQLDLTMGDRITINSAAKSHNADHFIIGESHNWSSGGNNPIHETKFYLEPASTHQAWLAGKVGYSEAGLTTYGGF